MPERHPEILYFAPTDPSRGSLAGFSRKYLSALQQNANMSAMAVLHERVPEDLHGRGNSIELVKKLTTLAMRKRRAVRDQIIHADLGKGTQREFWAAHLSARQRPTSPMCILFHTPPTSPTPFARPTCA